MNSKFYKIMLKVFMIFLFIIYFCANFSYGANKVSAKDIVSLYASGWEEKSGNYSDNLIDKVIELNCY